MTASRAWPQSFSAVAGLLDTFTRHGRDLFARYVGTLPPPRGDAKAADMPATMAMLARLLLSVRGEASGVAIARDLLAHYDRATSVERQTFFGLLADEFDPDPAQLAAAWGDYVQQGARCLPQLASAVEPPRQELFRRLNLAPGGTAALVRMRADLLTYLRRGAPAIERVDADLAHLLQSWFNCGFLELRAIDWSSPGHLLERVIRYEAVHHIRDWDDLRRRLDPPDRRCFGFFHPAMPDEPLIFVEVGLTQGIPDSIQAILAPDRTCIAAKEADTAVFYSISNSQEGLRGISFGHFLIKQVAQDLRRDLPGLACFVTLSPVPGFMTWLAGQGDPAMESIAKPGWHEREVPAALRAWLTERATEYFLEARSDKGLPLDPVARFHLGNGASLERLNWMGDTSVNGLRRSAGFMVNYRYDLMRIEEQHEAYAQSGACAVSGAFREQGVKKAVRLSHGRMERISNGESV